MHSISTRLMIYFILSLMLICSIIGIFIYYTAADELILQAENALPVQSRHMADNVDSYLYTHFQSLKTISNRNAVRDANWQILKPILIEEQHNLGYEMTGLADINGRLRTTGEEYYDISLNRQFQQALRGIQSVSEPSTDYMENRTVLLITTPVRGDDNKVIGVLTAILATEKLSNMIRDGGFNENSYSFIINKQNRVIAYEKKADNYSYQADNNNIISENIQIDEIAGLIGEKLKAGNGFILYKYKGQTYYLAYAAMAQADWLVVITIPRSEVLLPLKSLRIAMLLAFVMALLLAYFLAVFIQSRIGNPIRQISAMYSRMAGSDFSAAIDENWRSRNDEVGELARGFEQINRSMSHSISELEASEKKYRIIAENMVDFVAQMDLEGNLVYISPSHDKIINWDSQKILGTSYLSYVHPEDIELIQTAYRNTVDSMTPARVLYRFCQPDGRYRWVETVANPLTDDYGKVTGIITSTRDVHRRKLAEEKMQYMSEHDTLTGLKNRQYFKMVMSNIDADNYSPSAILVCDLDGLKLINDTLGLEAGDKLLLAAAGILKESSPPEAVVARIGGDEFGILIPGHSLITAVMVYESINEAVKRYNQSNENILSISIGYAVKEDAATSMDEVFIQADEKMYRQKLLHSQSARSAIVDIMMKALEARDFVTEGHTDRLQVIAARIAEKLGLSESTINDLALFARFHDIGKVGISDTILFKEGRLTPEEYEEMKKHSEIGYKIAQASPELIHIAEWILKHHEWWNGNGYPLGLKGEDIPLECRIVGVADAYDAMHSDRPYRKALSNEEIIAELKSGSGTQFDPAIIEVLLQILAEENQI